jgi:hypothetical protein
MITGRSAVRCTIALCAAAIICVISGTAPAGPKCGSSAGTRTQTFTCGLGEYINHAFVEAGLFAARIKFGCVKISNAGNASPGKTSAILGGKKPGIGYHSGTATCPADYVVSSLETQCGLFVDKVRYMRCGLVLSGGVGSGQSRPNINAGGPGGTHKSLQCPQGQGIYSVRVNSGDWIDSIEVFCR